MAYTTLGDATQVAVIHRQEKYAIVIGYPVASAAIALTLPPGMPVKITAGLAVPVAAVTDKPIGISVSNYQGNDPLNIRVMTYFQQDQIGYSDGITATGNDVACSGFDATTKRPKYKVAVAGDWVVGQVINGAASGAECQVGIFRVPYQVPTP